MGKIKGLSGKENKLASAFGGIEISGDKTEGYVAEFGKAVYMPKYGGCIEAVKVSSNLLHRSHPTQTAAVKELMRLAVQTSKPMYVGESEKQEDLSTRIEKLVGEDGFKEFRINPDTLVPYEIGTN